MKMKTLYNPEMFMHPDSKKEVETKDIIDYPISEAQVDAAGEILYDKDGSMLMTNRTLTWSIKRGEDVKFPEYVADYLLSVFPFLEARETVEETKEVSSSVESESGEITCKYCGQTFKNAKAYGLHMAFKHKEELLK